LLWGWQWIAWLVSIASGIFLRKFTGANILTMAFFFGFFQALMHLSWDGFGAAGFSHFDREVDHWLVFLILAFLWKNDMGIV